MSDGKEGAVKGERFQVLRSEELAYCEVIRAEGGEPWLVGNSSRRGQEV